MDDFSLVSNVFERMGWRILKSNHINANGTDLTAIDDYSSLRVEIKRVRVLSNGSWQAQPITETQRNNDIVAVILPGDIVILEDCETYISNCSASGYRQYTKLRPRKNDQ